MNSTAHAQVMTHVQYAQNGHLVELSVSPSDSCSESVCNKGLSMIANWYINQSSQFVSRLVEEEEKDGEK